MMEVLEIIIGAVILKMVLKVVSFKTFGKGFYKGTKYFRHKSIVSSRQKRAIKKHLNKQINNMYGSIVDLKKSKKPTESVHYNNVISIDKYRKAK